MKRPENVNIITKIIKKHNFVTLYDLIAYLTDEKETVLAKEVMDNGYYYNDLVIWVRNQQ